MNKKNVFTLFVLLTLLLSSKLCLSMNSDCEREKIDQFYSALERQSITEQLYSAAEKNDLNAVEMLLATRKADLDSTTVRSYQKMTILGLAVNHNNEAMVRALLHAGANPNLKAQWGMDLPLNIAARQQNEQLVILLLMAGALPNADKKNQEIPQDPTGGLMSGMGGILSSRPGLTSAAQMPNNIPIMQRLLDAGSAINAQDWKGTTALMVAAVLGLKENVEFLLSQGANPSIINVTGDSAKSYAQEKGHNAIVALLEKAEAQILESLPISATPIPEQTSAITEATVTEKSAADAAAVATPQL